MFKLIFDDPHRHLSNDDRQIAEEICADTATELRTLLPALPKMVRLRIASRGRVIPQLGFGARSNTKRSVSFSLDPTHPKGSAALLREHLRAALFHECHHLVRGWCFFGGTRRKRFIDGVVHEGLAVAFERDAAGHAAPWTQYPSDVRDWVDELLALPVYPILAKSYAKWMFHHPDGRLLIGYRAGLFIADRAIAASGLSAAELAQTSCEDILAMADIPLPPSSRWQALFRQPRAASSKG
ncbi:DUF2268 domain-containing putative Zn-dependent protease [Rhodanobacter sp. AS-Z3]|uniref:DUF2268 domain-containing putative Zn-dependent protease n=1 Tax=Rhodanobacter sp. AS-Z3 TaxID=3031330 RepID=UPI0024791903|nr:DUF2268 domain-containing putative Zn-dependent protease [Rhodanobacter sp. AS-Z3]WEN14343.1 DUF2268 domain-containing putative Zn-dependent protease [Rhodanobacter sp. AS-Z3]